MSPNVNFAEDTNRMDVHKNARLTPKGREAMVLAVDGGLSKAEAARQFNTTTKTVTKWLARFRAQGVAGLQDRSSRPHTSPRRTPARLAEEAVALRRQRLTQRQIAGSTGLSPATVSRLLRPLGLGTLEALEPKPPIIRYERDKPGEIIHIDIKKLGRIDGIGHKITGHRQGNWSKRSGWEFVHVAVDDHSRTAYTMVFPDETKASAIAFLQATMAYFAALGVEVAAIMTDNGGCYLSKDFRKACSLLGIKHKRTKPYTPRTNGKAERFIQTVMRECTYASIFESSLQRTQELQRWTHRYNWHRPHSAIDMIPPIRRLNLDENNVLQLHT
jgi:transposase InsO family protein